MQKYLLRVPRGTLSEKSDSKHKKFSADTHVRSNQYI